MLNMTQLHRSHPPSPLQHVANCLHVFKQVWLVCVVCREGGVCYLCAVMCEWGDVCVWLGAMVARCEVRYCVQ